MVDSIKQIFDDECKHLVIDVKLIKRIRDYAQAFVNRNEDHVNFFGGNLLGVHPIRFRTSDRSDWYDNIMEIDDVAARNRVLNLTTVNPDWVRGTDVMNLSCLWLVHKIYNSNMTNAEKEQGMIETLMVLQYKQLTSLMTHFFKYPADEATALAVYASLSKKYALKLYGSWNAMLLARSKDIIRTNGIHHRAIEKFDSDGDIQYMVTDIQGRLRGVIRKMTNVFKTIHDQDTKIRSTKGMVTLEGQQIVRDVSRNYSPYKRYLHEICGDKSRFIKDELVGIVASAMHTMPEKHLVDTLAYMSDHYGKDGKDDIEKLLDETLLHAFDFLAKDEVNYMRNNDIGGMITKLRAIYMSSRSTDPALMLMRDLAEHIVEKAVKTKNSSLIASIRTGVLVYLVLRAFTKSFYD